ncbi:MAG: hypothetical protein DYG96_04330 [Chlorobi bacterium CHB2]|nr:hypothetical protein [Chlorobi bacterium CHB2]
MFVGREDEIHRIHQCFAIPAHPTDAVGAEPASIIAMYGLFGAGKTTLLRRVRRMIEKERLADAMFVVNEDVNTTSLPEFVYHLATGFISLDTAIPRFYIDETDARRRRYLQIMGRLGADTMPLLTKLRAELHHQSSHPTAEGTAIESELLMLEHAVKNQFNNPDDQRLTLNTGNVLAESFIVDLMNTMFPLSGDIESLAAYLQTGQTPKRIVIVIDTFEKITPLLNPWLLESLLPYLYEKRFGDFHSYRTPYLPAGTFVREFFDVRFVIAGRERLSLTDLERRWDRYREALVEIPIGPFTRDELAEFLQLNGFKPEEVAERVIELTQGLPYLVALWADATRASSEGAEQSFVNALAEQRIFWYKTDEQREWIRAAAFLDWFDADALRCFPAVGHDAERAFEYLRNSSEVSRPSVAMPGKYELHGIIRDALRQATFQQSSERGQALVESATAFANAWGVLSRFDFVERDLLRRLAFFAWFDSEAIRRYCGGQAHRVRAMLDTAPDLFLPTNGTGHRLSADAAQVLERYNRRVEIGTYQQRLQEVEAIWQERKSELEQQSQELQQRLAKVEEELRMKSAERRMKAELHQSTRGTMGVLESDLQTARKRRRRGLTDREAVIARTSFFFMVLCFLAFLFVRSTPIDPATQELVRSAALALTLLFTFVFTLMLGRILYLRSRKKELRDLREDEVSTEDRLSSKRYELHTLGAEAEIAERAIAALEEKRAQLRKEIEERQRLLQLPYV